MFDEKDIELYQHISAPTNLREKVFSSCQTKETRGFTFWLRTASSVTVCLALVLVLFVFSTKNSSDILVWISNDSLLMEHSYSVYPEYELSPSRIHQSENELESSADITSSTVAFSITLDLPSITEISVSSGEMQLTLNDTVSSGTTFTVENKVSIVWYVTLDDSDNAFVMTLESESKSENLILDYNDTNQTWIMSRQKVKK